MSKRAAAIFSAPAKAPAPDDTALQDPPLAGNWSRIAYRDMQNNLSVLRGNVLEGVLSGTVPLAIPAKHIIDEIESDRLQPIEEDGDPTDPASFASLVENIRSRGQRTPIRVRPQDPLWMPEAKDPQNPGKTKFLLQSGRRRLLACKRLGITPIALISFPLSEVEITLPASRIVDNRNSEKGATQDLDVLGFKGLQDDIEKNGQIEPIILRATDTNWRPEHEDGSNETKFTLVDGGRRLEACRALGIDPRARISYFEEVHTMQQDLQERFYENVSRRDLSTVEKLLSIGLMAASYPGRTQEEIAEILQVSRSHVTKGVQLYERMDEIQQMVDVSKATFREIERALASKDGMVTQPSEQQAEAPAVQNGPSPFRRRKVGSASISLSRDAKTGDSVLHIRSSQLDEDTLAAIEKLLQNSPE